MTCSPGDAKAFHLSRVKYLILFRYNRLSLDDLFWRAPPARLLVWILSHVRVRDWYASATVSGSSLPSSRSAGSVTDSQKLHIR